MMMVASSAALRASAIALLTFSILSKDAVHSSPTNVIPIHSPPTHIQPEFGDVHEVHQLTAPPTGMVGASIAHQSSFAAFSFEPAFWVEFFGTLAKPNSLTFSLLDRIYERGGRPLIRPGGITMDSMMFDPSAGDPVRITSKSGGVYRTTVGPNYYKSWSHFPEQLKFVSTLNFGNDSLAIAQGMAEASVKYQPGRVEYMELGNEPTNYAKSRWHRSTDAYVAQWKKWTLAIDAAIDGVKSRDAKNKVELGKKQRWWASSATTDQSGLRVRPVDIIPAGIDSAHTVAQYSIHSYPFATCDAARAKLATLDNILNHTGLVKYADHEIMPSAEAALRSGRPWVIGEFNSVACSGQPGVTDTFAQALWVVDTELIYAVRNASSVHLHQGATLVFQSSHQVNTADDDGKPGFSTYDFVYPEKTNKRGESRALPSFVAQLFLAEAFASPQKDRMMRIVELSTPRGIDRSHFAAYAFYNSNNGELEKLALINMKPYLNKKNDAQEHQPGLYLDISSMISKDPNRISVVKRMTAPKVDEMDSNKVTWAGQSFTQGKAQGQIKTESLNSDGTIKVRDSEAVLIFFNSDSVYTSS
ncbi:uncharacterized protein UTRI_10148 [Ustilago trichophora]|uniref:Uncharacterized protein n=1 Tax=Ustilago trichophora TaxID=86804 RepID=A0A5C3E7A0_9BASI|nr:uncharacterized protein UTRI_10148 [Ustilago trichophora]